MKALVYDGVKTMNYRDMPDPEAGPGEALIKVEHVGICGSDMHGFLGHDPRRPAPLILGHEAAGVIVGGARDGERVTVNPMVPCGTCPACKAGRENVCPDRQLISLMPRQGAFAEYLTMPENRLLTVPDTVSLADAALVEPLAVSWHASRLALQALPADMERRALVIGGGAIGLAASLTLKAMGVTEVVISEPNEARAAFLNSIGEDARPSAEGLFPLVIDAVGYAATRATASAAAEPGGVIAHIGLGDGEGGLDIRRMTLQEITFIGTYCYTMEDFRDTAQALFDGKLGPINWTEARPLTEGQAAFDDLLAGRVPSPKIVLAP